MNHLYKELSMKRHRQVGLTSGLSVFSGFLPLL